MISLYNILFTEAAKSIQDAESNNFGLYVLRESGYVNIVLYDAELFYKTRINNEELFDNNPVYGLIIGRNDTKECGAYMVVKVVAKDKFGPLMYDLMMSITSAPLMSDRGSVSEKAQSVWDYIHSHKEKYKPSKLKRNAECESYLPGHGVAFSLINKISYLPIYSNHKKLLNNVFRVTNDPYEEQQIEQTLLELGEHLWDSSAS